MAEPKANIRSISKDDFDDWQRLFRAYIDFYKSSLPEEQYRKTFDRLVDPETDLYGLVLEEDGKMIGIAHFFPHQTPWSEKKIMHFNDLFIDPGIRGHGYGRKMILAIKERATELGCFRLEWATQNGNPARKLYDQLATQDFVEYRVKLA